MLTRKQEDLGLGRIEELPMEDGENTRGGTRGGFWGGASRGGFRGGGHRGGGNLGRATRETLQAITTLNNKGVANAWQGKSFKKVMIRSRVFI